MKKSILIIIGFLTGLAAQANPIIENNRPVLSQDMQLVSNLEEFGGCESRSYVFENQFKDGSEKSVAKIEFRLRYVFNCKHNRRAGRFIAAMNVFPESYSVLDGYLVDASYDLAEAFTFPSMKADPIHGYLVVVRSSVKGPKVIRASNMVIQISADGGVEQLQ